jgi:hypothetical protein
MSDDWKTELDSAIENVSSVLRGKQKHLEQRIEEQDKAEARFVTEIERRRCEAEKEIEEKRTAVERQREELDEEKHAMQGVHKFQSGQVKLDVGGHRFTTSLSTLTKDEDSMLAVMFSGRHELTQNGEGAYFIDRDGTHFRYVLNYLRDGEIQLPFEYNLLVELLQEANYYQLSGLSKRICRLLETPKMSQEMALKQLSLVTQQPTPYTSYTADDGRSFQFQFTYRHTTSTNFSNVLLQDVCFSKIVFQRSGSCRFWGSILRNVMFIECFFEGSMDFTGAELYDVSFKCCGGGIGLRTNLFHGASKKVRVHFDP